MSEYDTDALAWSEQQAALLRRVAAGDAASAPDWDHIIEEIEGVGLNSLRACRSLLVQALAHDLKAASWPNTQYVARWRHDAATFRLEAREVFTPSMRQRLDLDALWRRAQRELPFDVDGTPPLPAPPACPATLDELLGLD